MMHDETQKSFFELILIATLCVNIKWTSNTMLCLILVRPQHSALPLILFVFIHDFASLTQFTHSFHFLAYLMSRSLICYFNQKSQEIISRKLNQMSQFLKNIFSNKCF